MFGVLRVKMPLSTPAYAVHSSTTPLEPWTMDRRDPLENDVLIDILFCGVCHSDLHQARDEWGGSIFGKLLHVMEMSSIAKKA